MDRSNPYEAAFEAYLKARGLCYIGVDEARRALLNQTSVKNLDFIVLGTRGARLLVDIKGRKFPGGPVGRERYVWENWSTQEDIDGMTSWTSLFGNSYLALFVFMYRLMPSVTLEDNAVDVWSWHDERYLLRAVTLPAYRRAMRTRSPKWGTVALPGAVFRELARPFQYYTHEFVPEEPHGQDPDWDHSEVDRLAFASLLDPSAKAPDQGA